MNRFPKTKRARRAFTLIELLVVIAIISILAALLLPIVSKAKNQAGKATDLNNLKQIMVAVHVYASDNSDVLASANWDDGRGTLPGWLYTPGPTDFDPKTGQLWPTLLSGKIYACPSDDLQMVRWSQNKQRNIERPQQISSYAMNGAVVSYSWNHPPTKLTRMQPGDCAFWETDETEPINLNDGANYPPEGVSGRHVAGGVQAAFDGSVSYVKLTQWHQEIASPTRNRLWCDPNTPDGHGAVEPPSP